MAFLNAVDRLLRLFPSCDVWTIPDKPPVLSLPLEPMGNIPKAKEEGRGAGT